MYAKFYNNQTIIEKCLIGKSNDQPCSDPRFDSVGFFHGYSVRVKDALPSKSLRSAVGVKKKMLKLPSALLGTILNFTITKAPNSLT